MPESYYLNKKKIFLRGFYRFKNVGTALLFSVSRPKAKVFIRWKIVWRLIHVILSIWYRNYYNLCRDSWPAELRIASATFWEYLHCGFFSLNILSMGGNFICHWFIVISKSCCVMKTVWPLQRTSLSLYIFSNVPIRSLKVDCFVKDANKYYVAQ